MPAGIIETASAHGPLYADLLRDHDHIRDRITVLADRLESHECGCARHRLKMENRLTKLEESMTVLKRMSWFILTAILAAHVASVLKDVLA